MIWDSFLRFLLDLAWLAGLWLAAALLIRLLGKLRRWLRTSRLGWRIRGRRAMRIPHDPPRPGPPASEWSAAFLVRPSGDRFMPGVQLRGSPFPSPARIRLELIDEGGGSHPVSERDVCDSDLGHEVWLPEFAVPEGHEVDDVLAWVWRVVLQLEEEEFVLCLERLRAMTGLTPEAEIGAPEDRAGLRSGPPRRL